MNELRKLEFLNSCGIYLKDQKHKSAVRTDARIIRLIRKWEKLSEHCFTVSNDLNVDYTLRPREFGDFGCPLCDLTIKTISAEAFSSHDCFADSLVVPMTKLDLTNIRDRQTQVKRKAAKKTQQFLIQSKKLEPLLCLQRNARTLGKILAFDGPGALEQLFTSAPVVQPNCINLSKYSSEIKMIEELYQKGHYKFLKHLAMIKAKEKQQAEKRELFARKRLNVSLNRSDFQQMQKLSNALVTTPVKNSTMQDILPLSVDRSKQVWPMKETAVVSNVRKQLVFGEQQSSSSSMTSTKIKSFSPIKNDPEISFRLNTKPIETTTNFLDDHNFKGKNEAFDVSILSSEALESIISSISPKNNEAVSDTVLPLPSTPSSSVLSSPMSENQVNKRARAADEKSPARKTRRLETRNVRSRQSARTVQFSIGETPSLNQNGLNRPVVDFQPKLTVLNGRTLNGRGKKKSLSNVPSFLVRKVLAEHSLGIRSLEGLTTKFGFKAVEKPEKLIKIGQSELIKSFIATRSPVRRTPTQNFRRSNIDKTSPLPAIRESSGEAKLNGFSFRPSEDKDETLCFNVSPNAVGINQKVPEAAFLKVSTTNELTSEEKSDLLLKEPKVSLSSLMESPQIAKRTGPHNANSNNPIKARCVNSEVDMNYRLCSPLKDGEITFKISKSPSSSENQNTVLESESSLLHLKDPHVDQFNFNKSKLMAEFSRSNCHLPDLTVGLAHFALEDKSYLRVQTPNSENVSASVEFKPKTNINNSNDVSANTGASLSLKDELLKPVVFAKPNRKRKRRGSYPGKLYSGGTVNNNWKFPSKNVAGPIVIDSSSDDSDETTIGEAVSTIQIN